jgi:hypothetical protein
VRQAAVAIGDRTQCFECDVDAALRIPRIQPDAEVEGAGVGVLGACGGVGECCCGLVERGESGDGRGDRLVGQIAHGGVSGRWQVLVRDRERAGLLDGSGIRVESAGEDAQQGRLAAAVLAHDGELRRGGHGHVDVREQRP